MKRQLFLTLTLVMLSIVQSAAQVIDSSAQWTWMGGDHATVNRNGVFTTQGAFAPGNIPGSRQAGMCWRGKDGNFWMFGGVGTPPVSGVNGHLNDLWKYDVSLKQWAFMNGNAGDVNRTSTYGALGAEDDAYRPAGRSSGTAWVDTAGNLWLFGGNGDGPVTGAGAGDYLNDLWRYNVTTNRWAYMGGSVIKAETGKYGTKGTPSTANRPGGRYQMLAWSDHVNTFWFFSGHGPREAGAKVALNELWKYNPVTAEWTWVAGSKTADEAGVYGQLGVPSIANLPGSRNGSQITKDAEGNVWLFGGNGYGTSTAAGAGRLNDLWKFIPATGAWAYMGGSKDVNQAGTYGLKGVFGAAYMPGGRFSAWLFAGKDGGLWLIGGRGYPATTTEYRMNDVWKFDTTSRTWAWMDGANVNATPAAVPGIQGTPAPANTPAGKTTFVGWEDTVGNFWIFGGVPASGIYNDLWRLAPVLPPAPDQPSPYTMARGNVCVGESNVTYTVPAITGATSYDWEYNGTNATFTANTPTPVNSVSFAANATGGTLRVRAVNAGGGSPWRDTTITVNTLPTVTSTNTGARSICAGDSLLLTAGGSSGVNYQWKQNATNVGANSATYYAKTAGSYTVTVTHTGTNCSAISAPATSLTVNPLPVVSVTAGSVTEVCAGETVTLTAAITSGASYQWKSGSTPVGTNNNSYTAGVTGAYKVVVTDISTGCSDSTTPVEVFVYDRPVASLLPGDTSFCDGGLVMLSVESRDTGLTYRWKKGSTTIPLASAYFMEVSETGAYTVVTGRSSVAGCEDTTNEVVVTVHPLPVVDITWDGKTLHATPGHASYQWYTSGQPVPGATDATFDPLSDGGYSVTATDTNGCSANSPVYNVTVGVSDLASLNLQIKVYPNPTSGLVHIASPLAVSVSLSSIEGKVLIHTTDAREIDLSNYAEGVYMLRIADQNGRFIRHEKLIRSSR